MKRMRSICMFLLVFLVSGAAFGQGTQQYADLGDFALENGAVIKDCKLGYRIFGTLNAAKSNAVLIPTWFTGKTADLVPFVGPGKLFDDTTLYLIFTDAIGNGISSSPSTSTTQPGASFPEFTIADMVRAQHRMLTEKLGLKHLRAVTGISMGGMQTFQWMTLYPDFIDRAIPIVGTPRQTAYDILLWSTELSVIQSTPDKRQAMKIVAGIHALTLTTPRNVATQTKPEDFPKFMAQQEQSVSAFDPVDFSWQLKAMLAQDITKPFGGSFEKTAAAVKAKILVIVSREDHMVNPSPALELAKIMGAETLELTSVCGHMDPICEMETVGKAIARFLK